MKRFLIPCFLLLAGAASANDSLPHTLRSFFGFTLGDLKLVYYQDNAKWSLLRGDTAVAEKIGFEIEFADGTVLRNDDLGVGTPTRVPGTHDVLGNGVSHTVDFAAKDGLKVYHRLIRLEKQSFLTFQLAVENTTETPVTIKRLSPVVVTSNGRFAPGGTVTPGRLVAQGYNATFSSTDPPLLLLVSDEAAGKYHYFGVLPEGRAQTGIDTKGDAASWQGAIHSNYHPGVTLQRNEVLESDKVTLNFSTPSRDDMLKYYAYAYSTLPRHERPARFPRAWVSAGPNEGMAAIQRAAQAWSSAGVSHALIPDNWEARPGSLKGGGAFGGGLDGMARDLKGSKLTPGLTFDPLAVNNGGEGTFTGGDGVHWANPNTPEGAQRLQSRVQAILGAGFGFLAVSPSRIPDEALAQFNISRGQADAMALQLTAHIAGTLPVFPAGRGEPVSLANADFPHTAALAKQMSNFGVVLGPVRVTREGLAASAGAAAAWPGPIEIWGGDSSQAREALASFQAANATAKRQGGARD